MKTMIAALLALTILTAPAYAEHRLGGGGGDALGEALGQFLGGMVEGAVNSAEENSRAIATSPSAEVYRSTSATLGCDRIENLTPAYALIGAKSATDMSLDDVRALGCNMIPEGTVGIVIEKVNYGPEGAARLRFPSYNAVGWVYGLNWVRQ